MEAIAHPDIPANERIRQTQAVVAVTGSMYCGYHTGLAKEGSYVVRGGKKRFMCNNCQVIRGILPANES